MWRPARRATCASSWRATRCARRSRRSTLTGQAGAHSAPLGLAFYTGARFPADYAGDAFMAYHGSWNRSVPTGAKVVRVHVQNGRPVSVEDFVTGWQLADGSRWGRPVGLLVMPDGALLVSDGTGDRIWRVSYVK